jgi:hypothetical protein
VTANISTWLFRTRRDTSFLGLRSTDIAGLAVYCEYAHGIPGRPTRSIPPAYRRGGHSRCAGRLRPPRTQPAANSKANSTPLPKEEQLTAKEAEEGLSPKKPLQPSERVLLAGAV